MYANNAAFFRPSLNAPFYLSEYYRRNRMTNPPQRAMRRIAPIDYTTPQQSFPDQNDKILQPTLHTLKNEKLHRSVATIPTLFTSTFKHFSDNTTLHGFRDLHYSKSFVWKFIWLCAIVSTVGVSAYQLYSTALNYLEKPTVTLIQPLATKAEYPPLTICYVHWLLWVDWDRGTKLGFDKPSILYGMSFLSEIVSEITFDVSEAKLNFISVMKRNGFTKMGHFYTAVSSPSPPGIKVQYLEADAVKWEKFVDPVYSRLCYRFSDTLIKQTLAVFTEIAPNSKNAIEFLFNHSYFELNTAYVSLVEYEVYVEKFLATYVLDDSKITVHVKYNISDLKVSPFFNFDNIRTNIFMLSPYMFEARLRLAGALYKWMNDDTTRPCSDKKSKFHDYCDKFCHWKHIQKFFPEKCIEVAGGELIGENNIDVLCTYNMYFLPDFAVSPGTSSPSPYILQSKNSSQKSCIAAQCPTLCNHWKYVGTLSTIPFPNLLTDLNLPTLLDVEYPYQSEIIVFTEVSSLTWESMVGDIGGIVGLWLGASIMSLLQVIYLCCCSGCDGKLSTAFRSI